MYDDAAAAWRGADRARHVYAMCRPFLGGGTRLGQGGAMVEDAHAKRIICPSPILGPTYGLGDEATLLDNALPVRYLGMIRAEREALVKLVDSAVRLDPVDPLFIGQLVRLLVDQGRPRDAAAAADACLSEGWWCALLAGFARSKMHAITGADSTFGVAATLMPDRVWCRIEDIGALLERRDRDDYSRRECKDRRELNARFWWLADPLYIDAGNERRAAHYARWVTVLLRQPLGRDERFDWRDPSGGGGLVETVIRFGWPSYVSWPGEGLTLALNHYLKGGRSPVNVNGPLTTFEYSSGRLRTAPSWTVMMNPAAAGPSDLMVNEPQRASTEGATGTSWGAEHFMPRHPIVQLGNGQTALLRRADAIVLAVATDLVPSTLQRPRGDSILGSLITTRHPDTLAVVDRTTGIVGAPLIVRGEIAPAATVVSVEVRPIPRGSSPDGRLRFGVTPPPPISVMSHGEIAVSSPILLAPVLDSELSPPHPDSALARMLGSTVLPAGTRMVGVYWEAYGFAERDSVDLAIWIERVTPQGLLRRLGAALRISPDLSTPVAVSWSEPRPGAQVEEVAGSGRAFSRYMSLDVATLPRGEYRLEVAMARRGGESVRGRTTFVIQ